MDKDIVNLSLAQKQILDNFLQAYRSQEQQGDFTQQVCAQELHNLLLLGNKIGINQEECSTKNTYHTIKQL